MGLTKQAIDISFSKGLDTKVDPFRVSLGNFLSLNNSVFDIGGRLTKRNGYGPLVNTVLGNTSSTVSNTTPSALTASYLTTFNGDLTAVGDSLFAYAPNSGGWVNKGNITPISLTTLPLVKSSTNQSQGDSAVAPNGYVCTTFTDNVNGSAIIKYVVADSVTGQNITKAMPIPVSVGTPTGSPRVFVLGSYFIIVFTNVITATSHLQYIAVSINNPLQVTAEVDIANSYAPAATLSWDGVVYSNSLFVAYNTTSGGQSIKVNSLNSNLVLSAAATFNGEICTMMSICVDTANSVIWAAYYDAAGSTGKAFAVNTSLATILAPTAIIASGTYLNITATATSGLLTFLVEQSNNYPWSSIPTHLIQKGTLTQSGTLVAASTLIRSVGLASKAFLIDDVQYFLGAYQSPYQPTYFLINSAMVRVISILSYSNGGGYDTLGLPGVSIIDNVAKIAYLTKDFISASNKTQGSSLPPIYSQTGVNLASFAFTTDSIFSTEIGANLNLTGGFVAAYDGTTITEQGFFLWPDSIDVTTSTSGGSVNDGTYFYQVTYEWADSQGNVFRSAPSVPVTIVTSGGNTSTNTLRVPTLRLTYKTENPVKIVVYRWSQAQQVYYAIKSPSATPTLNNTSVDYVTITDTQSDASILGNPIIYTTGGVLEDIGPPASDVMTLFNNRLWLVDAEDRNLLWYSKQVIEATPVEMSDLLTLFIAPTTASQGSTGPITALSPMDDKLIIFKENALGFINGIGPDNTGANGGYSDFTLINSVVGCNNPKSIVFTPQGLLFQSNKGIWLLGRDLSTQYIGAPVEALTNGATVQSALNIPTKNQVRFTLSSGITLMYDYYYGQWGEFTNVPAISATIYQNLHTYINSRNNVFQETPNVYLDGTSPVLMSFTTGWINLSGLQGFERFYYLLLLGTYLSPFKLNVQIAYDFNPSFQQSIIVTPDNFASVWGDEALWGSGGSWGGTSQIGWEGTGNVFEARVFPQRQKCESFQISMQEVFDSSKGQPAGAGLTLSGFNLVAGMKRGFRTQRASRNFG